MRCDKKMKNAIIPDSEPAPADTPETRLARGQRLLKAMSTEDLFAVEDAVLEEAALRGRDFLASFLPLEERSIYALLSARVKISTATHERTDTLTEDHFISGPSLTVLGLICAFSERSMRKRIALGHGDDQRPLGFAILPARLPNGAEPDGVENGFNKKVVSPVDGRQS